MEQTIVPEIRGLSSISQFKSALLKSIRPKASHVYNINNPIGLKLLTRLRLNFSHLREHKFNHNFSDSLVPFCNCGQLEAESTSHFLLRCPLFSDHRKILLDNIIELIGSISNFHDDYLINILLYGDESFKVDVYTSILHATIVFLISSERFDLPLF